MKRAAVAVVDDARCIGCTRCIEACPVDAIVGAQGLMHTVVEPWCIGCRLCLPPCPVDCIDLVAAPGPWTAAHKQGARLRAARRKARLRKAPFSAAGDAKAVIAAALSRRKKA
jgi:electron transport complex protein RnfB